AARPSRIPRCKLANLSLVAAADRTGTGTGAGTSAVPGIRFACGTRLGKPATVVPPDAGATATSAARQPSSEGDDQLRLLVATRSLLALGHSTDGLPRRNQSD